MEENFETVDFAQTAIKQSFFDDPEEYRRICMEFINIDGRSLRYVKRQDLELCIAAVKNTVYALPYVDKAFYCRCLAYVPNLVVVSQIKFEVFANLIKLCKSGGKFKGHDYSYMKLSRARWTACIERDPQRDVRAVTINNILRMLRKWEIRKEVDTVYESLSFDENYALLSEVLGGKDLIEQISSRTSIVDHNLISAMLDKVMVKPDVVVALSSYVKRIKIDQYQMTNTIIDLHNHLCKIDYSAHTDTHCAVAYDCLKRGGCSDKLNNAFIMMNMLGEKFAVRVCQTAGKCSDDNYSGSDNGDNGDNGDNENIIYEIRESAYRAKIVENDNPSYGLKNLKSNTLCGLIFNEGVYYSSTYGQLNYGHRPEWLNVDVCRYKGKLAKTMIFRTAELESNVFTPVEIKPLSPAMMAYQELCELPPTRIDALRRDRGVRKCDNLDYSHLGIPGIEWREMPVYVDKYQYFIELKKFLLKPRQNVVRGIHNFITSPQPPTIVASVMAQQPMTHQDALDMSIDHCKLSAEETHKILNAFDSGLKIAHWNHCSRSSKTIARILDMACDVPDVIFVNEMGTRVTEELKELGYVNNFIGHATGTHANQSNFISGIFTKVPATIVHVEYRLLVIDVNGIRIIGVHFYIHDPIKVDIYDLRPYFVDGPMIIMGDMNQHRLTYLDDFKKTDASIHYHGVDMIYTKGLHLAVSSVENIGVEIQGHPLLSIRIAPIE